MKSGRSDKTINDFLSSLALFSLWLAVISMILLFLPQSIVEKVGIQSLRTTYYLWIKGGALVSLSIFSLLSIPSNLANNGVWLRPWPKRLLFYIGFALIYSAIMIATVLLLPQTVIEYLGFNNLLTSYSLWVKEAAFVSLTCALIIPWVSRFRMSAFDFFPRIPLILSALAIVDIHGTGRPALIWVSIGNVIAVLLITRMSVNAYGKYLDQVVTPFWRDVDNAIFITTYPIGEPRPYDEPGWIRPAERLSWSAAILLLAWTLINPAL